MGDNEISNGTQTTLELNLNGFHLNLMNTTKSWDENFKQYGDLMQKSIDDIDSFFKPDELTDLHQRAKKSSITQVCRFSKFEHILNFFIFVFFFHV